MAANWRKQEQRQADREQQKYGFRCTDAEVDHLNVDVAIVVVPVVVMVPKRALHHAVEAVGVDVRVYSAQLRPD
jgi:hypothetical protein